VSSDPTPALINEAYRAVLSPDRPLPLPVAVTGRRGHLPSRLAVEDTAVACVAAALSAAAALMRQRERDVASVTLDRGQVAAAVTSERYFVRGGEAPGAGFAPLSRFWRTADGWVRTHANYPWHRDALLGVLRTPSDVDAVGAAIAARSSAEVEEEVFAAGGVAAAVRSVEEWRAHPQGQAVGAEPLVGHEEIPGAAPRRRPPAELPASGVRVLDLTRVIAGPVCTRYLGACGAEVLRLDPPAHPDMRPGTSADTLLAKRSAWLDLTTPGGARTLHDLLGGADVLVGGYRPGALDRFGLSPEALAERHPGLVIVYLDAWGHHGPWAHRRGFDSVVQAPTGIAVAESDGAPRSGPVAAEGVVPGALPCQLLDHGTGYLAAAAVMDGLRRQHQHGGTHIRRLSLARTAGWLQSASAASPFDRLPSATPLDPEPWLVELASGAGSVRAVAPPGALGGTSLRWQSPVTGYGDDLPVWTLS
jgi:crotonobetainyl-CoA:carnitine CoA-transferase CaiB-like acyl-CoA transferase